MLKRLLAILLLAVFGLYSFTFKTHYCYHLDGSRFHGDCRAEMKAAEQRWGTSQALLHDRHYVCYDISLEKQYKYPDYTIKSMQDHFFILPPALGLLPLLPLPVKVVSRLFASCDGPPVLAQSLRGPPSCTSFV